VERWVSADLFTERRGPPPVRFRGSLARIAPSLRLDEERPLRATSRSIARGASVVVDATDNFASRLLADAARALGAPSSTPPACAGTPPLAASSTGRPFRCLFEDLPEAMPRLRDAASVRVQWRGAGCDPPSILRGETRAFGFVLSFDGLTDRLRRVVEAPRRLHPLRQQRRDSLSSPTPGISSPSWKSSFASPPRFALTKGADEVPAAGGTVGRDREPGGELQA
jgi:hypothetical protein